MLNQEKIGKFIAERRKHIGLTQKQLAEQISVSDKAVSKWETGRCMPDNAILFDLCKVLEVNINELLSGEKLSADNYHGKAEENIMTLIKEKKNNSRINAIVGIILGISFLLLNIWLAGGNINLLRFYDIPSLVLILLLMLILLYMCGLTKYFFKGIVLFFRKNKTVEKEELCHIISAFKLLLIALPIGGMVVTLISFVTILGGIDDVTTLVPRLAVAILTLLYSLIIELLLLPVLAKLWTLKEQI